MIHPSAVIHPSAQIADNVTVGPFSVIEEHVSIDEGTIIGPKPFFIKKSIGNPNYF